MGVSLYMMNLYVSILEVAEGSADPSLGAAEATQQLLGELLGSDPSLDGLDEVILDRTSGNPFFIEEVVRSLVEDGILAGHHGVYRLARTLDEVRIPDTVRAVLEARLDRLQPAEKELLQLASVIGNVTSERLLRPGAAQGPGERKVLIRQEWTNRGRMVRRSFIRAKRREGFRSAKGAPR